MMHNEILTNYAVLARSSIYDWLVFARFRGPRCFQNTEPLHCCDDVTYMYYRGLKTLRAPADLIRFLGSLTGEMRKRGAAIWERVVQGADMKSPCWFSLCCGVGLILCLGGLIVGTWGKTGTPVAGVTPPKSTPVNEYV